MMATAQRISSSRLEDLLGDWRSASGPAYQELARRVELSLVEGRLSDEVLLPAERRLAGDLGISRTTVAAAYELLRERGFLETRHGAGSITSIPDERRQATAAWPVDSGLGAHPLIDFSLAAPGAAVSYVREAMTAAAERLALYLENGDPGYHPLGLEELRSAVAASYRSRGLATSPEQILITAGGQQAIDLVFRLLLRPLDTVLVESPTYPGALDAIRRGGARMIGLDVADQGFRPAVAAELFRQTSPALVYVIPDHHNPTGHTMGRAERRELAKLVRQHHTTLVVDEALHGLHLDRRPAGDSEPPSLAVHLDGDALITVGSLSKSAWGGLRIGWIRSSAGQVRRLAALRTTADFSSPVFEQLVAVELLGRIDEILERRRASLRQKRDVLLAALRQHLGWDLEPPAGGVTLWARIDASSADLSEVAPRFGLRLTSGSRFSPDGLLDGYLRLPFTLEEKALQEGARRLALAWREVRRNPCCAAAAIV